jgi:two-component system NtrC family sensor kinase
MTHCENRRVLVIDDEPFMHQDYRNVLADRGYSEEDEQLEQMEEALFGAQCRERGHNFTVSSAHQGEEGLEIARAALMREEPFAVAFVDMRMPPGWDGMRTVRELWRLDPELQVVICTAYSDYPWQETLKQLQANDRLLVVKKPFDPVEIRQAAAVLAAKWAFARQVAAIEGRQCAAGSFNGGA